MSWSEAAAGVTPLRPHSPPLLPSASAAAARGEASAGLTAEVSSASPAGPTRPLRAMSGVVPPPGSSSSGAGAAPGARPGLCAAKPRPRGPAAAGARFRAVCERHGGRAGRCRPAAPGAVPAATVRPGPQPPLRDIGEGDGGARGEPGRAEMAGSGRRDAMPPAGVPARRPLAHQGLPEGPVPGERLAPGIRAAHAGASGARRGGAGAGPGSGPPVTPGAVAGGDAAAVGAGPGPAAALPRLPQRHVPAAGGQCQPLGSGSAALGRPTVGPGRRGGQGCGWLLWEGKCQRRDSPPSMFVP